MNKRLELVKTLFILLLIIALVIPLCVNMASNAPENKGEMIQRMLIHQEDRRGVKPVCEVEPAKAIEEIWELEDLRFEAEDGLVQAMYWGEYELGFDKQSHTFYCSVGMDGEEWPELTLHALGDEEINVVWVDDYTYDDRKVAVREGYSYELFAYTDNAYSYFNLVFTGLPIVSLYTEEGGEIGEEYIPARVTVFGQGFSAIDSAALVHTRGGWIL